MNIFGNSTTITKDGRNYIVFDNGIINTISSFFKLQAKTE